MYKQIFNKSDGAPKLIETGIFDTEQYTEIQPPNGLYQPIHFDGKEWIGTPYEEWKKQQVEVPKQDTEVHKNQIIAELSLELIRTQEELSDVRKDVSDLTIQLLGGNANA
ncbi:hypothetical protein K4R20_10970 [Staphylococcus epidermidis]|uniref:hypothetical protein n=1 Tax=Staphylococcus epidermidis TaxID=1282 RepID=UPI0021A3DC06|nr:hypothetical protein [Staphylococcus epidermidis]MCG1062964.1 hypothetical protein [Staphylococcus epidermidis]MCT1762871.1 hypothetical protein [Staphylococcus epidermidis]MCT1832888.1 hypothetical protein [Staphylococcus epidermidis]